MTKNTKSKKIMTNEFEDLTVKYMEETNINYRKSKGQYFTPKSINPKYLRKSFEGRTCLHDLGYTVKTGRLVWNQNKELLTNNPNEGIPLIWAHNITQKGLKIPIEHKKPQYVKINHYDKGPAIVVNRITGAAKSAKLRAAIVPANMKFIAENHCNVIFPPHKKNKDEQLSLESIVNQLESPEKLKVMQNITGNTQISKTELAKLFPVDV